MIPKIVHRTIPKNTSESMDICWDSVIKHTDGWTRMTHYDDDEYDIVAPYLDMCKHGVFKGDLIRLEAIYKYGGVYLDADIMLFKNIDSLLDHKVFLSLENDFYAVNSVIGAEPKNEHILNMLYASIDLLKSGMQPFGVNATHNYAKDNDEITKLPSENFIMYYGGKEFMQEKINLNINNPNTYGQHLFTGTWVNK